MLPLPPLIVGDHRIGRIQNGLGGPVILLQANGSGTGVLLLKIQDILNGCPPEPVNTLVIVTDNTDIAALPSEKLCQKILHMVGILILVNQNIMEFSLVKLPDFLILLEKLYGHIEDVVKIQGVVVL